MTVLPSLAVLSMCLCLYSYHQRKQRKQKLLPERFLIQESKLKNLRKMKTEDEGHSLLRTASFNGQDVVLKEIKQIPSNRCGSDTPWYEQVSREAGMTLLQGNSWGEYLVKTKGICFPDRRSRVAWIVMEDMSEGSLGRWLSEEGLEKLSEPECHQISIDLCRGLSTLHHLRIIHGDISRAHVLLHRDSEGKLRAKLGGFGHSILPGRRPEEKLQGTEGYIAPECLWGNFPDEKSDIYSLGMTLAELWTGKTVVESQSLKRALRQAVESPSDEYRQIKELIEDCIDPNLQHRPKLASLIIQLEQKPEPQSGRLKGKDANTGEHWKILETAITPDEKHEKASEEKENKVSATSPKNCCVSLVSFFPCCRKGNIKSAENNPSMKPEKYTILEMGTH